MASRCLNRLLFSGCESSYYSTELIAGWRLNTYSSQHVFTNQETRLIPRPTGTKTEHAVCSTSAQNPGVFFPPPFSPFQIYSPHTLKVYCVLQARCKFNQTWWSVNAVFGRIGGIRVCVVNKTGPAGMPALPVKNGVIVSVIAEAVNFACWTRVPC